VVDGAAPDDNQERSAELRPGSRTGIESVRPTSMQVGKSEDTKRFAPYEIRTPTGVPMILGVGTADRINRRAGLSVG
jgi:hypothetical protein